MAKLNESERDEWFRALEEDVIQGEFGYEPGEFSVYRSDWIPLYKEGLTPRQAWQRAMDGHKAQREEDARLKAENWARIQAEDAIALAKARGETP